MAALPFDDARLRKMLEAELQAYPAGNHCDVLAQSLSKLLYVAGYDVAIVTIMNEAMPGTSMRAPYIPAKQPDGSAFLLAQTGFHDTVRVMHGDKAYYVDGLAYLHRGMVAISEDEYFELFVYPDALEVTNVRQVE